MLDLKIKPWTWSVGFCSCQKLTGLKDTNAGWLKKAVLVQMCTFVADSVCQTHPAEQKRKWVKKDEQEWLRIRLAWNELAIPETFWSELLEVLMKIEGDSSFTGDNGWLSTRTF